MVSLKGLGKSQLEQRKRTEEKIMNNIKKTQTTFVNKIIRETKLDPTAVINAIERLTTSNVLIQLKYKNKKLVSLKNKKNIDEFQFLKKQEQKEKRSKAHRDIIVQKMLGKAPKHSKQGNRLLEIYSLERKLIQINDLLEEALNSKNKKDWMELYTKRDMLYMKIQKLRNPSSLLTTENGDLFKGTTVEKKLELFEKKIFLGLIPGGPIEFEHR